MTRTVLVTGGRGKTGREVVRQLEGAPGVVVRSGSSKPADAQGGVVRSVAFDWDDPAMWRDAVTGADAVYLMRPDRPDAPGLVGQLVELNPASHVVLLSEQGADALAADHWARRVESAVIERAERSTILRPSWFQQVLTDPRFYRDALRNERVLSLPSGGTPIAWVDARDIASVAVAALLDPREHAGVAHTITGPEAVSVPGVAELLSANLPTPVRAVDPPVDEELRGLDPWIAGIVGDLYRRVRDGDFAPVSPAVEAITGRAPRTVEQFIAEHRDEWLV